MAADETGASSDQYRHSTTPFVGNAVGTIHLTSVAGRAQRPRRITPLFRTAPRRSCIRFLRPILVPSALSQVLSDTIPHQASALNALMNCRRREPVVDRNLVRHVGDVGGALVATAAKRAPAPPIRPCGNKAAVGEFPIGDRPRRFSQGQR